jgi:hypothetical protein
MQAIKYFSFGWVRGEVPYQGTLGSIFAEFFQRSLVVFHFGGFSPGERSQSLRCAVVSAWRAFLSASLRAELGGRSRASSRKRRASLARRCSKVSACLKRRRSNGQPHLLNSGGARSMRPSMPVPIRAAARSTAGSRSPAAAFRRTRSAMSTLRNLLLQSWGSSAHA